MARIRYVVYQTELQVNERTQKIDVLTDDLS